MSRRRAIGILQVYIFISIRKASISIPSTSMARPELNKRHLDLDNKCTKGREASKKMGYEINENISGLSLASDSHGQGE
jgi:hypothetical protein